METKKILDMLEIIKEIQQISIFCFWNKYKPLEQKRSLEWFKKELKNLKSLYWKHKKFYQKIKI